MIQSFRETVLFLISTPLYIIFIGLELYLSNHNRDHLYSKRGAYDNLRILLVNLVIDITMRAASLFCLIAFVPYHVIQVNNPFIYWITLILLQDLSFYCMHYVDHHVRLFWAVHVTHHSAEEFNLGVGFRSSVFEPLYRFFYFIPLVLLGYAPLDIFFAFSLIQLYGIFIHTQYFKRSGPLGLVLVTPSHHRVHHGKNPKYIDQNMGMFLIVWDKIFGTFTPETEAVIYGVTKSPKNNSLDELILHEFRNMISDVKTAPDLRSKLLYIFGPPGWKPADTKAREKEATPGQQ